MNRPIYVRGSLSPFTLSLDDGLYYNNNLVSYVETHHQLLSIFREHYKSFSISEKDIEIGWFTHYNCKYNCKPELGLTPKFVWKGSRIQEIKNAINVKIDNNKTIPIKWIEEYNAILEI